MQVCKARRVDPALHAAQIGQRQLDIKARVNQLAERRTGGEADFDVDQIIGARRARPCDSDCDQARGDQGGEQAEPGCESGRGQRVGHAAHGNQRPAAGGPCDRLSFVIRDRTTPTAFRGFPWWLPLITALIGALIALAIASSATASWVADARLWVRSDVSQSAGLSEALRDPQVLQTTLDLNGLDWTPDQLAAATRVVANEGLVTVTVTARSESEAEGLATSLASAAIEQHRNRTRGAASSSRWA